MALSGLGIVGGLAHNLRVVFETEIVEGSESADDGRQGGGDLRVGGVGVVGLAIDHVLVDLGVEGSAELGDIAREFEGLASGIDLGDAESMRGEPGLDGRDVLIGGAELLAERRRE